MTTISEKLARLETSMNNMRSTMNMSETSSVEEVETQVLNNKNGLEEQATEIQNLNNIIIEKDEEIANLNTRIEELEGGNTPEEPEGISVSVTNEMTVLTTTTPTFNKNDEGYITCSIEEVTNPSDEDRLFLITVPQGEAHIIVHEDVVRANGSISVSDVYRSDEPIIDSIVLRDEPYEEDPILLDITLNALDGNEVPISENYLVTASICDTDGNVRQTIENHVGGSEITFYSFTEGRWGLKVTAIEPVSDEYPRYVLGDSPTYQDFSIDSDNVCNIIFSLEEIPEEPSGTLVRGDALTDGETISAGDTLIIASMEDYTFYDEGMANVSAGDDLVYIDDNNKLLTVINMLTMGMTMAETGIVSDGETLKIVDKDGNDLGTELIAYIFDSGGISMYDSELGDIFVKVTKDCTVTFTDVYKNFATEHPLVYKTRVE